MSFRCRHTSPIIGVMREMIHTGKFNLFELILMVKVNLDLSQTHILILQSASPVEENVLIALSRIRKLKAANATCELYLSSVNKFVIYTKKTIKFSANFSLKHLVVKKA